MTLTFPKSERLKSRTLIQQIFAERQVAQGFPIIAFYKKTELPEGAPSIQVGFSVSKKKFKKAVTRNLLKRRMREAYRLHRRDFSFYKNDGKEGFAVLFVFVKNEIADFQEIEKGMLKILRGLEGV